MYDRQKAVDYAQKWALSRNPAFYDFDNNGGDCTNFNSQCLYAGSDSMNYTPVLGWYYISSYNRSPSWTGVEFLYKFITSNTGSGVYGEELPLINAHLGDIIQLSFNGRTFAHSLFITQIEGIPSPDTIYICTHTNDSLNRQLSTYYYEKFRLIHIEGAR